MARDYDIAWLDKHIKFLTQEAQHLKAQGKQWAYDKADKMLEVVENLTEQRRGRLMAGMNGVNIELADLQKRLRSAEGIISQAAMDTFGREMTPKEFAEASSYDS